MWCDVDADKSLKKILVKTKNYVCEYSIVFAVDGKHQIPYVRTYRRSRVHAQYLRLTLSFLSQYASNVTQK